MTKSFEEFEVHKKSVLLTVQIYRLIESKNLVKEYNFNDQLKRAVVSISNNIAEGSEYNSNKQFIRFLRISKGSCAEVRNMLILGRELGFLNEDEIKESYLLSIDISQSISKFITYLSSTIVK